MHSSSCDCDVCMRLGWKIPRIFILDSFIIFYFLYMVINFVSIFYIVSCLRDHCRDWLKLDNVSQFSKIHKSVFEMFILETLMCDVILKHTIYINIFVFYDLSLFVSFGNKLVACSSYCFLVVFRCEWAYFGSTSVALVFVRKPLYAAARNAVYLYLSKTRLWITMVDTATWSAGS